MARRNQERRLLHLAHIRAVCFSFPRELVAEGASALQKKRRAVVGSKEHGHFVQVRSPDARRVFRR